MKYGIKGMVELKSGSTGKVKVKCTHCGKKQIVTTVGYSLNNVACKFCKKEGELINQ